MSHNMLTCLFYSVYINPQELLITQTFLYPRIPVHYNAFVSLNLNKHTQPNDQGNKKSFFIICFVTSAKKTGVGVITG